jgi:hypothetical protein
MTKINFHSLFGLPILITSIDPNSYDKEKLLVTINENYKKQKIRDSWDKKNDFFQTDIHHSNMDESNKEFNKLDYTNLTKCYHKPIETYFSAITSAQKKVKYFFEVVNYSAVKHNSFMKPHTHAECDFAMVHYVSFNQKQHIPTIFLNPCYFSGFLRNKGHVNKILNTSDTNNSWAFEEWRYDVEEDDIIIFPSLLKHYVRNKDSEKLRVTIASNVYIEQ